MGNSGFGQDLCKNPDKSRKGLPSFDCNPLNFLVGREGIEPPTS